MFPPTAMSIAVTPSVQLNVVVGVGACSIRMNRSGACPYCACSLPLWFDDTSQCVVAAALRINVSESDSCARADSVDGRQVSFLGAARSAPTGAPGLGTTLNGIPGGPPNGWGAHAAAAGSRSFERARTPQLAAGPADNEFTEDFVQPRAGKRRHATVDGEAHKKGAQSKEASEQT